MSEELQQEKSVQEQDVVAEEVQASLDQTGLGYVLTISPDGAVHIATGEHARTVLAQIHGPSSGPDDGSGSSDDPGPSEGSGMSDGSGPHHGSESRP